MDDRSIDDAPSRGPRRHDLLLGGGAAAAAAGIAVVGLAQPASATTTSTQVPVYSPVSPYRYFDSRDPGAGGPISGGQSGEIAPSSPFPDTLLALCFNLTITDTVGAGYLALFPADEDWGGTSNINWYTTGQIMANNVYTGLAGDGGVTVLCGGSSTDFVLDVMAALVVTDLDATSSSSLSPGARPLAGLASLPTGVARPYRAT